MLLLLLCSTFLLPFGHADTVVLHLQNGDRLTGTFVAEDATHVTLDTVLGRVRIPRPLVHHRELSAEPAAPTSQPAPDTSGANAAPEKRPVPAPAKATPSAQATPEALASSPNAPRKDRFLRNVHGSIQVGTDLGFGTKDRQLYTARAQATYAKNRLQNGLDFNVAYGKTDKELSANRLNGEMRTTLDFGQDRKAYAFNIAAAGYDQIRKIELSYDEGAGLGYKPLSRSNLVASLEAGGQYHQYLYTDRTSKENISTSFGQALTWNISRKLIFKQKAQFLPDVNDFGDYRLRIDASLSYPLWKSLTLNLNLIDLFDSRPPRGVRRNDLTIQSSLGITF
jgi:putative salt-induced outer membrane protein